MAYLITNLMPGDALIPGARLSKGQKRLVNYVTPAMLKAKAKGLISIAPDNQSALDGSYVPKIKDFVGTPNGFVLADVGPTFNKDKLNSNFATIAVEVARFDRDSVAPVGRLSEIPNPISAYKVVKGSQKQTYTASAAGIFSVPTRLLSYRVISVSGGSATIYANSANSGTAIATGINVVNTPTPGDPDNPLGATKIPGGYNSFLGLSLAITGTIQIELEWETNTDGVADDVYIDTIGYSNYSTVLVTATRAGIRSTPSDIAGFFVTASSGGSLVLYDNYNNTGDQIYSGTPALNSAVSLSSVVDANGLSAAITGTLSLALQVR